MDNPPIKWRAALANPNSTRVKELRYHRPSGVFSVASRVLLASWCLALLWQLASARFCEASICMQVGAILKTLGATPKLLGKVFFPATIYSIFLVGALIGLAIGGHTRNHCLFAIRANVDNINPNHPIAVCGWAQRGDWFSMLAFCLPLIVCISLKIISVICIASPMPKLNFKHLCEFILNRPVLGMYGLMCVYTKGFLLQSIIDSRHIWHALLVAGIGLDCI